MTSQMVLTVGRDALTLLLMIAMPVLGVVMGVGLLVSVFQAVTQIHEATLAFVPKLIAAMVVFAIAGPWMLSTLVDFIRRTILSIPSVLGYGLLALSGVYCNGMKQIILLSKNELSAHDGRALEALFAINFISVANAVLGSSGSDLPAPQAAPGAGPSMLGLPK